MNKSLTVNCFLSLSLWLCSAGGGKEGYFPTDESQRSTESMTHSPGDMSSMHHEEEEEDEEELDMEMDHENDEMMDDEHHHERMTGFDSDADEAECDK